MKNYKEIIAKMSFEEKAVLLTGGAALSTCGNERLSIPEITMSDGPHGVRRLIGHPTCPQECNIDRGDVCYPTASAVGATWNISIAYEMGAAVARDCLEEGINMLLAPAVNMKRTPHCGRNFEYYSEDPVLSGMLAAEFINGVQESGVGTSLKHYAANNQEIDRGTVNVEIDERTLREYYLKVFEIVLKNSNPTSVMCAYNKLNGIWCSENKYLLNDILKEEWGYGGLVVSDWGAVHDIGKALASGLDLSMPRNKLIVEELKHCIELNTVSMEDIDRAVEAMLKFTDRIKALPINSEKYSRRKQHDIAYKAAAEAITLLKNDDNILPITSKKYKKIAVIGKAAQYPSFMGGGSSCVSVDKEAVDIPIDYIRKCAGDEIEVTYCPGFAYEDGFFNMQGNDGGVERAVSGVKEAAANADIVLVFVTDNYGGEAETEEIDRQNLMFPNYVNYSIALAQKHCENVVVIMQTGSAIIPYQWHDKVKGIVQMWYAGEACGKVIADVLFGKVNPSGKLSETFILKERMDLDYPGDGVKVCYNENNNVAYHYYDLHSDEIWYPFGHGLSYTTFEYSDIKIDKNKFVNENVSATVSFTLKNTGPLCGKEIVQMYIKACDSIIARPVKELKKFSKTELLPGEEKKITFSITNDDLVYYNVCLRKWHIENGRYKIMIGASSLDIRLSTDVEVYNDCDYSKDLISGAMVL